MLKVGPLEPCSPSALAACLEGFDGVAILLGHFGRLLGIEVEAHHHRAALADDLLREPVDGALLQGETLLLPKCDTRVSTTISSP